MRSYCIYTADNSKRRKSFCATLLSNELVHSDAKPPEANVHYSKEVILLNCSKTENHSRMNGVFKLRFSASHITIAASVYEAANIMAFYWFWARKREMESKKGDFISPGFYAPFSHQNSIHICHVLIHGAVVWLTLQVHWLKKFIKSFGFGMMYRLSRRETKLKLNRRLEWETVHRLWNSFMSCAGPNANCHPER